MSYTDFSFSDPGYVSPDVGYGSGVFTGGASLQDLVNTPLNAPGPDLSTGFSPFPTTASWQNLDPTSDAALSGNRIFPGTDPNAPSIGGASPPLDFGTGGQYSISDATNAAMNAQYSPTAMVNKDTSTTNDIGSLLKSYNSLDFPSTSPVGKSTSDKTSGGDFWSSLTQGLGSSIGKSLPGALAAGGGLIYSALNQKDITKDPNYMAMAAQAAGLNAQGQQLASYLASGTLPAGLQAAVDRAKQDAKTAIMSRYASLGLPTDPKMNSQLAAELQNVDLQATIQIAQIGQQLLQTGVTESGLSQDIYSKLLAADQNRNASMSRAVSNFASALGGGSGGGQTGTLRI